MAIQIDKDIISLSKFRASCKQYIDEIKLENRSLVLTQNGQAAAVIISPQKYNELKEQQRVVNMIASRLQDISEHRFVEDKNKMWRELVK